MTPLAQKLVRQFIGEGTSHHLLGVDDIGEHLLEAHCFDISEIREMVNALVMDDKFISPDLSSIFLPAPKTWIEYRIQECKFRCGVLLIETHAGIDVYPCFDCDDPNEFEQRIVGFHGRSGSLNTTDVKPKTAEALACVALAMINTPKIVGRRQHMPHRGLEKRLLRKRPNIGKFPLHAWTEIQLKIGDPRDASGDGSVEAHYTGQKALHFCRAHLRIKMGRLELVKSHWRGDPSLGIKRSRYKVSGQTRTNSVRASA